MTLFEKRNNGYQYDRIYTTNHAIAVEGDIVPADARLLPGDPDEVIAAQVREHSIKLLVMGAYGHSRIREFILGSTTTSLLRTCRVPVLLFR